MSHHRPIVKGSLSFSHPAVRAWLFQIIAIIAVVVIVVYLIHNTVTNLNNRGITSGFLFVGKNGRPVTTRGIHSQLKHYAIRYGIDPTTMYPHSFRHRFAKNFLSRSGDISLLAD